MDETERYKKAKKRVEAKLAFYIHAAIFAAVNLLLIVVNLATSANTLWFVWPLMGWGIGLAIHGATFFLWITNQFSQRTNDQGRTGATRLVFRLVETEFFLFLFCQTK